MTMPGTLVLLRHGQSQWNLENRFTGWEDVDLTDLGRTEAEDAGDALRKEGMQFDAAHVSLLRRSICTLDIVLDVLEQQWVPVRKSWRLNERHYGALQGLNKAEVAEKHGEAQVLLWRRSYDVSPPPLGEADSTHPRNDRRYAQLDVRVLPRSESLADTLARVMPYWHDVLAPQIKNGSTILVVAHGNSIRALYKYLNKLSAEEIVKVNIPTGIPLHFSFGNELTVRQFRYLGDPVAAGAASKRESGNQS